MISSPIGCGSRWLPRRAKPESSKPMFSSQSWTTAAQDKVNFVELGFNKQKTNYLPPNILNRSQSPKNLRCFQICLENSAALTEVVVFGREAEAHWCCRQFGGRSLLPSLPASLLWGRGDSGRAGVQGVHIQVYQIYPFFFTETQKCLTPSFLLIRAGRCWGAIDRVPAWCMFLVFQGV